MLRFNSFMVQLQAYKSAQQLREFSKFQFLHGTITRIFAGLLLPGAICFNSFMVQLQELAPGFVKCAAFVFQFLHGTITSIGATHPMFCYCFVSIPSWYNYKYKKSRLLKRDYIRFKSFMVQLQAHCKCDNFCRNFVSIPSWYNYKVANIYNRVETADRFQFLHGTITSCKSALCKYICNGVSIPSWYNYKAQSGRHTQAFVHVSIPSWYNYKRHNRQQAQQAKQVSIPSWYNYKQACH